MYKIIDSFLPTYLQVQYINLHQNPQSIVQQTKLPNAPLGKQVKQQ